MTPLLTVFSVLGIVLGIAVVLPLISLIFVVLIKYYTWLGRWMDK